MSNDDTRVPLWRLTDEQLRAYIDDDLVEWSKRQTAVTILVNRHQQRNNPAAFAAQTSEGNR